MNDNSKTPAFHATPMDHTIDTMGLTKREYFAGLAMQGILSTGDSTYTPSADYYAKKAVLAADALLLELSK